MRDSYHEQLDDILADLVQMCQKVAIAVRSSTTALLEADIHLAEQVIGDDDELDRMQSDIEERAFHLLARQAPVAGELRTVVASLRMVSELERMGVEPGGFVKVSTRRGEVVLKARADRDVAEGMVFIAFCFAEAAANLLTNPQLDPMGKIPEFKFCAAKVEPVREGVLEVAE